MKTSQIFTLAKLALEKRLWRGDSIHVCWAITDLRDFGIISRHQAIHARIIVGELIWDHGHLEGWLVANGHAKMSDFGTANGKRKLYTTKQAWLDHLIGHYHTLGD
jgi:hypothetical protein